MKKPLIPFISLFLLTITAGLAQHHQSPYQNQVDQPIKALSAQDIDGYLNGRGMGLAKPAELNGYPGPMHVLEVEKELHLTIDQKTRMQQTYEGMHSQAVALGKQIIEQEKSLNGLFANHKASPTELQTSVATLALLQGQLRLTHLEAHLKTKEILSPEQVDQYNKLRGYTK